MSDLISRKAAINSLHMHLMYRMGTDSDKKRLDDWINSLPSAQGKPFNLPEIYIADGYDTIEGEDGNVGFGVYVPDENQIYVAGDVEGEIRARALLHEICHWVQAMCGRSFDEDEANEFSDIVYDALPSAQETHEERTETHACDLIDRQAAIDLVKDVCDAIMSCCGSHYDEETDDEVYDDIREIDAILKCNKEMRIALKNMPSAEPERKTGKWIYNSPVTMKCNQCGLVIKDWDWHRFKYCPNCYSDMRGGRE